MEKENIVMTKADYLRLMGDLSLLFDAVKEMSGVLMSYESTGFISQDNVISAVDYAAKSVELDNYWIRATKSCHIKMPEPKKGEA